MSDLDEIRQAQEAILDEFYGCEEDAVEELMLERMENARLRAEHDALRAKIDALLVMHQPDAAPEHDPQCLACGQFWPCEYALIRLAGEEAP